MSAGNLHKNCSDAQRHNPKGFDSASNDTVLTKNSSGNVSWQAYGSYLVKGGTGTITGDNSTTLFTITHNLGTRKLHVSVIDRSDYSDVQTVNKRNGDNTVTVDFKGYTPTGSDVYDVVITGMV